MKPSKQIIKSAEILTLLKYYFEDTDEIAEDEILSIVTNNKIALKFANDLTSILSKSNLPKNELFKILFEQFII